MENINSSHTSDQRKETLNHIKEYIIWLLGKKKQRALEQKEIKKELEQTMSSTSNEVLKKKEEESWIDRIKNLLSEDEDNDTEGKNWWSQESIQKKWWFELPPEDQDEYIPQDSEFGEALWESSRFAEIFPPYLGYYTQWKKSYFDPSTNLRSKKKSLSALHHSIKWEAKQIYTYAWYIQAWITAVPLPEWALPNTTSLSYHGSQQPIFQVDQNDCVYLISKEKQPISFQFALNQVENNKSPIIQDTEKIIFSPLTQSTQRILTSASTQPTINAARIISHTIKTTKKYNTNKQGTMRNESNSKNYINTLDESQILECYSANILDTALTREINIPARLIVGHMIQSVSNDGKSHLNSNNGHAWTEIRDGSQRVRIDATPTTKENEEPSNQNMEDQDQDQQSAEGNMDDSADNHEKWGNEQDTKPQKWWEESWWEKDKTWNEKEEHQEWWEKTSDKESSNNTPQNKQQWEISWPRKQKLQPSKSAEQMLDEFIKKAKEDNLTAQWEQLTKALDQLEQAESKEDIRKILDEAWLSDFAKEEIDKIGNQGILEEEKKELESIEDEQELEQKLGESLLDPEYKKKLKEYADIIKQKIEEQKKKMKSEMERFGFSEQELWLYKQYKQIEKEVMPEVRKQIEELKKVLPPQYLISRDEETYYRSGARLDRNKLVDRKLNGDTKIFQRSKIEEDSQEINMFETIIIDRSWSMGSRSDLKSPFTQSVKAAIIRAKVLEHFKVDMSIVIFDDSIDEVMNFWEIFSERRTKIPSKLMRAYTARSWWNSQEPITHVYHKMKERMKQLWGKSFGNISFIGDGDLYSSQQLPTLKAMINDLKKQGMGVTAYYINKDETKMPLIEYYFGKPEDGHALYAKDSLDLSTKIIENHKTKLNLLIRKYLKRQS